MNAPRDINMKTSIINWLKYATFTSLAVCSVLSGSGSDMFVLHFGSGPVKRFDGDTGAYLGDLVTGNIGGGADMAFGPDGNLYVADWGTSSIKRFDTTNGAFMGVFVPKDSGELRNPEALLFGPDRSLYVGTSRTESGMDFVRHYDGTTGASLGSLALGGLDDSDGLAFGLDGKLYVSSYITGEVKRFDTTTGAFIDNFIATGAVGGPVGLAFGADGNLYVSCFNSNQVKRFDGKTGALIDTFVAAGLNKPYHITFGPDGNLYVANYGSSTVKRFSGIDGAYLGIAAQGNGLSGPTAVLFLSPPTLNIAMYAGIEIAGITGRTYRVEYATTLPTTNWTTLTNIGLPSSPYLLFDATSRGVVRRFYRATQLP
jgi:DNA-binding beta-propeller fold protein YncE